MGKNRIAKYLREMDATVAKCVIVSDFLIERVTLSIYGQHLVWAWNRDKPGISCPGALEPLSIHPLAAEALVVDEIHEFLSMEGLQENEVCYVNSTGSKINGIYFHPEIIGDPTYDVILKKEKLKDLYVKYKERNYKLSQELIGDAIAFGVLEAFLSLVNL